MSTEMFRQLSLVIYMCLLGQCFLPDVDCLKGVTLLISPPAVKRGKEVVLHCEYDLEGDQLYSAKWYRGTIEIYRFSPNEDPMKKVFPFQGINVDLNESNATQVVLRDVGFNLSGEFSCEVSIDAPRFSTLTAHQNLLVVEIPEREPELNTDKLTYTSGDILRANCTSAPSRPAANLTFSLNGIPVGYPESSIYIGKEGQKKSSMQYLTLHLSQNHFEHGPPILTCKAYIQSVYTRTVETRLSSGREPIPERVMSSRAQYQQKMTLHPLTLFTLVILVVTR